MIVFSKLMSVKDFHPSLAFSLVYFLYWINLKKSLLLLFTAGLIHIPKYYKKLEVNNR